MNQHVRFLKGKSCDVCAWFNSYTQDRYMELCTVGLTDVPDIRRFLEPAEPNRQMINVYFVALLGKKVAPASPSAAP